MTNLAITISGKETASRIVKRLEGRFQGLTKRLKGVAAAAKKAAAALGTIAAATGALLAPLAALAGSVMLIQFLQKAREQSNDLGREMARVMDVFNRVAKIVGDILAPVISLLADELEKLVPAALTAGDVMENDFVKKLMHTAYAALKWGVNIVTELARGLIEGAKLVIPIAMNAITGMLSWFLSPGSAPRVAKDIGKWAIKTMEFYLSSFADADFSILEAIQGPLQTVLGLVGKGGKFAGLSQGIAQAISSGQGLEKMLQRLKAVGGKFGGALAELAKRHFDVAKAARAVEEAERRLADSYKATDKAAGALEKLRTEYAKMKKEGASTDALDVKEAEIDAAQKALDTSKAAGILAAKDVKKAQEQAAATEKRASLQERLLSQLTKMEQIQENLAGLGTKMGAAIGGAIKAAVGGGAGIGAGFTPPTAAFDALKAKIRSKLKDLFKPLHKLWNTDIKDFIHDAKISWKHFKRDLRDFTKAIEDVWDPNSGTMANVMNNVVPKIVNPAMDAIGRRIIEGWEATKLGMAGVWDAIKQRMLDWLDDTSANLTTWLNTTAEDLYEGGRNIVQGLIDGIESKLTSMVQSIRHMAQDLLDAWNQFWQSHSPSRRAMDEMGKPIVEGVAQAFVRYRRVAQGPLEDMLSPGGGGGASLRGGGGGSVLNRATTNNMGDVFNIYDQAAALTIMDQQRRRRLAALGA